MKQVSLTFDDGPNPPYTNQILDILKKENIKATFFVCGANIKRHPETIKRIVKEGHSVGNHSFYHRKLQTRLGLIYKEILETQKLIEKLAPQKVKLFRSPYLASPFWLNLRLKKANFKIFKGVMGNDWEKQIIPNQIAENILTQTKDKTIIILHDGYNATEGTDRSKSVTALKIIIADLKSKDFQFVPIDQL